MRRRFNGPTFICSRSLTPASAGSPSISSSIASSAVRSSGSAQVTFIAGTESPIWTGYSRCSDPNPLHNILSGGRPSRPLPTRLNGTSQHHVRSRGTHTGSDTRSEHSAGQRKEATGRTAKEFVDDRVILEAKRLLAHDGTTVAECARRTGFDDPANFSKFFRSRCGLPPGAFTADMAANATIDLGDNDCRDAGHAGTRPEH